MTKAGRAGPRNIGIGSLLRYRFPIMAIASILHRMSGLILFFMIPFVLWLLSKSLETPEGFAEIQHGFHSWFVKFFVWVLLSAFLYHILAGIKHLIMDLGHLESLKAGRWASGIVVMLALVGIVMLGVWLC